MNSGEDGDLMTQQITQQITQQAAQKQAQACADAMYKGDNATIGQKIELLEIGPGVATMRMQVQPHQTNGHGMCHGGFIFMMADSCFAFACNSHNQRAVAASANIEFLAPAQLGDVLIARAREIAISGRAGHYEIMVTRQSDDALIAIFRGKSATIKGQLV
jgi:acyl-CoA thioesterase